eukprot:3494844-Rhodomonas_salina.1
MVPLPVPTCGYVCTRTVALSEGITRAMKSVNVRQTGVLLRAPYAPDVYHPTQFLGTLLY